MSLAAGLFRSKEPIAHKVRLPNGEEFDLWFRQLPRPRFLGYYAAIEKAPPEKVEEETAKLIAECLCEPDGSEALTIEQALDLNVGAAGAIATAILVVNKMAKEQAHNDAKNS